MKWLLLLCCTFSGCAHYTTLTEYTAQGKQTSCAVATLAPFYLDMDRSCECNIKHITTGRWGKECGGPWDEGFRQR